MFRDGRIESTTASGNDGWLVLDFIRIRQEDFGRGITNRKVRNYRMDFSDQTDYCIDWYETDANWPVVRAPAGL